MKKVKYFILVVIFVLFIFYDSNVYALENEEGLAVELTSENEVNYTETMGAIYVHNASLELKEDILYVIFQIDEYMFEFNISNYTFYSFGNEQFYLGLMNSDLNSGLINGRIEKCPNNEITLYFSFIDSSISKMLEVTIIDIVEKLDFIKLVYFNDIETEYYDVVVKTKSKYKELNAYYKKLNTPFFLSARSIDDSENAILAEKSLTKYQDESIKTYYSRGSRWDSNGNRIDDPIVDYIPRSYFFNECEHLEYGESYGFYIKTVEEATSHYYSFVTVFVLEFSYPIGTEDDILEENESKMILKFIPLFNLNYYSYIKDDITNKYINFGDSCSSFVLSDLPIECGYSDFLVNNYIENHNDLNTRDSDYVIGNDKGMVIRETEYKLINDNSSQSNSSTDFYYIDLLFSLAGMIPQMEAFTTTYEIISLFRDVILDVYDTVEGNTIASTPYVVQYSSVAAQLNNKKYLKEVTFGFDFTNDSSNRYCIGDKNYANYGVDYATKVGFSASVLYDPIVVPTIVQDTTTTFVTTLYDLSGTNSVIKKFIFRDTNSFAYLGDVYTSFGELNSSSSMDSIIPLMFDTTDIREFVIKSTVSANIMIVNQFGVNIFNKNIGTESRSISVPLLANERYFIKFKSNSSSTGSISCRYIDSITYTAPLVASMESYDSVGCTLTVYANKYYSIDATGSDTELYIYKNDRLIAYNDYWFTLDEEYNEEYVDEAHLYVYLESGTYYLITGKNSSSSNSTITVKYS